MPAKEPKRQFKVGDKIRVNLHHGKIEEAVVRAVIQGDDGIKLQVDVVGLDLTALIDARQGRLKLPGSNVVLLVEKLKLIILRVVEVRDGKSWCNPSRAICGRSDY